MDELRALRALARSLGVQTRYVDGLGQTVTVAPETLLRVCTALGVPVERAAEASAARRAWRARQRAELVPPVLVAWEGRLPSLQLPATGALKGELRLADGRTLTLSRLGNELGPTEVLPQGYHRLVLRCGDRIGESTVIAAPLEAWRRSGSHSSWGVGTHLAALRSARSRSVGDLRDLESVCRWIGERGGDLVTLLPLLPTFNTEWPEPSPYSAVSRLFWSELILDLGELSPRAAPPATLDVSVADAEVRAALADRPAPPPSALAPELIRYARFRGAQRRLGRNWRAWPAAARAGTLAPEQVDPEEERFHLVAQALVRQQLLALRGRLDRNGLRLGLDLPVGSHPDGYDAWSRQALFGDGMSVGAPPDLGFPSGQDWGFRPVLPEISRREGHRYVAASIAHQAGLAGVLRVDHIMAWTRLYWIPQGLDLHHGTYVSYPAEELFAILVLESNLNRCEVVGENLGTVPREIFEALPRHRIWGMYLAEFQASAGPAVTPPTAADVALVGTHDTPTFAGWLAGTDIAERVRHGLLDERAIPEVRAERARAVGWLAARLDRAVEEPHALLARLLEWLGGSESPLVIPWLEDFWLEDQGVNLPGTPSSVRPNWQRPMRHLLDEIMLDPAVNLRLRQLHRARHPESVQLPPAES